MYICVGEQAKQGWRRDLQASERWKLGLITTRHRLKLQLLPGVSESANGEEKGGTISLSDSRTCMPTTFTSSLTIFHHAL